MTSNDYSSFGDKRVYGFRQNPQRSGNYGGQHPQKNYPPKPHVQEDTLRTETLHIERKSFMLTLKENPRGRFLRITEDVGGRRDSIIIPATGLEDFRKLVEEMAKLSDETPPQMS